MIMDTISCSDCCEEWDNFCPLCKASIPVKQESFLIKKPPVVYNVFSNLRRIFGKRGECFYCKRLADTRDHFYPKSRGGRLTVHCCFDCNQQKGNLTPEQWLMYLDHAYVGKEHIRLLIKKNTKYLISKTKNDTESTK